MHKMGVGVVAEVMGIEGECAWRARAGRGRGVSNTDRKQKSNVVPLHTYVTQIVP